MRRHSTDTSAVDFRLPERLRSGTAAGDVIEVREVLEMAETKEQLGGILVLEARDLNHAIQLMSKHPGVKAGPFEICPAEDLSEMIRESERRRSTMGTER